MESLYTKYRPQTFNEVVGQEHVVETLKRAVLEGRLSHAYLFCGPRGTGKTTMARILAKALMCERGPAMLPDGTCDQCRLIAAGEHPDVIELDAASRTGVDNVREEIISRVSYAPVRGRAKIYIIDEVHMLTTAAFNALLKTLEEPPDHVVFVLCTTDPQKIPATILSRVQRFDFHAIGDNDIEAHLAYVCSHEGFAYDDAALELVVRHAGGGMRDALTTLEQLSVFGAGTISLSAATDFLGEVPSSVLSSVVLALATRDVAALFAQVANLVTSGRDLLQFNRELSARVRDVYVVSVAPTSNTVVSASSDDLDRLRQEAAAFGSADRIARALTILGDASSEMRTATNQRLVLEIAFTRIARPRTDLTLEALADRMSDLERQLSAVCARGARPVVDEVPVMAASVATSAAPSPAAAPAAAPASTSVPAAASAPVPSTASAPAAVPAPVPAATPEASNKIADATLQRQWKRVVDQLKAQSPQKGSLLLSSVATSDDGETLVISLPQGSRFVLNMLGRRDVREAVETMVETVFGPRSLVFEESDQALRPSKRPANVATSASVPQAVPAPVSQAVPVPESVLAPQEPPASASAPSYPMPWDEPEPAPVAFESEPAPAPEPVPVAPEPTDDERPPYDDIEIVAFEEVFDAEPAPAPVSTLRPAPAPASQPQSSLEPAPEPVSATTSEDLPPEFATIVANLAAAFGAPVSAHVETGPSDDVDDFVASGLTYDGGDEFDAGFTEEPDEDYDD